MTAGVCEGTVESVSCESSNIEAGAELRSSGRAASIQAEDCFKRIIVSAEKWCSTTLIPGDRGRKISEFEASLIYRAIARARQRNPVSKNRQLFIFFIGTNYNSLRAKGWLSW